MVRDTARATFLGSKTVKFEGQGYHTVTIQDIGCVPIFCDNTSTINIAKNLVQHKRRKHIDIRDHFLRNDVEKSLSQ